ncbi:MAG TPA: energy transducer TonB [Acidobacteriota bacterium]|nr:energy transducer TonB [Acidobacteriota bacterium]
MAGIIRNLWRRYDGPPTQPSLFHYIKNEPETSVWSEIDWSFLRHPIKALKEEWREPRTQASLFNYVDEASLRKQPTNWAEFLKDLFTSFRSPLFIPSVFADPEGLVAERAQLRTRKAEAGMLSLFVHCAIAGLAILLISYHPAGADQKDNVVFVNNPVYLPFEGDGRDGGGGGGGGKGEQAPPATGRMPEQTRVQMVPPDPEDPRPLIPADDLLASAPSVQMPIDIPQDMSLPIGDIMAPPNGSHSSGPGIGGGIGTGRGTGVGSGTGPGVGPGSGGGMGGGSGGGIGSGVGPYVVGGGVKAPVAIYQPLPAYTEEARKARAEGIVLIQAIIRRDGSVDSFKVLRGLGYGLDESAINTIATKWRFKPGTLNGTPVDVQANIEVSFRLY